MKAARKQALELVSGRTRGWEHYESIRQPRPSCLALWRVRDALRKIAPGERQYVGGVSVYRLNSRIRRPLYRVGDDGALYSYEQALAMIEGRQAA